MFLWRSDPHTICSRGLVSRRRHRWRANYIDRLPADVPSRRTIKLEAAMNNQELEEHNALVLSYLTLRQVLGILGILMPFVLALGARVIFQTPLQGSISAYYYTGMSAVFVGGLWAVASFLLAYKGYGIIDNVLADVGCAAAVGITLFPTGAPGWIGSLHFICGVMYFLVLIIFSLFLFTRVDPNNPITPQKVLRNRVYRTCGVIMFLCIVSIGTYLLLRNGPLAPLSGLKPEFWLESFALVAFGISWLTKGHAILQDPAVP
jgi:hypothetical protein